MDHPLVTIIWAADLAPDPYDNSHRRPAESLPLDRAAMLVLDGCASFLFPSSETAAAVDAERTRRSTKSQRVAP